ncbi:MAG: cycH [Gammaproteobacteria bacterium]|jgi:cytochrome c-type biogenesis protein CcmH|nr:cycH [Gammaproteobacteria bacterium]
MINLWLLVSLFCLIACSFIYKALTKSNSPEDNAQLLTNKAWYEDRLQALEKLYTEKQLSLEEFEIEKIKLQKDFVSMASKPPQHAHSPHRLAAFIISACLILAALISYQKLGASQTLAKYYADKTAQEKTENEIQSMGGEAGVIHKLEAKLKAQPDAQGYYLLGKIYFKQNRYHDAVLTFEKALTLAPTRSDIASELAEACYFSPNPADRLQYQARLQHALTLNPQDPTALNLQALLYYHQKKYTQAIDIWQKLLAEIPEGSDTGQALAAAIQDAQSKLGNSAPAAENQTHLSITVAIDPALQNQIKPNDVLFVYAKNATGSPMPLAITRLPIKNFPVQVELDDSMTMSPSVHLHDANQIIVEARISHSGQAMPQAGDLSGQSNIITLKNPTKNILITIQHIVT